MESDKPSIEVVPISRDLFAELYAFLNTLKRTKLPPDSSFEDSYALADALRNAALEAKRADSVQSEEQTGETVVLLDRELPVVFDEIVCEREGVAVISDMAVERLSADKMKIIILTYQNLGMRVTYLQGLAEGRGRAGYRILNEEEASKLGMALSKRIKEDGGRIGSGMKAVH